MEKYCVILEGVYLDTFYKKTHVILSKQDFENIDSMERLSIAAKSKLKENQDWSEPISTIYHFKL